MPRLTRLVPRRSPSRDAQTRRRPRPSRSLARRRRALLWLAAAALCSSPSSPRYLASLSSTLSCLAVFPSTSRSEAPKRLDLSVQSGDESVVGKAGIARSGGCEVLPATTTRRWRCEPRTCGQEETEATPFTAAKLLSPVAPDLGANSFPVTSSSFAETGWRRCEQVAAPSSLTAIHQVCRSFFPGLVAIEGALWPQQAPLVRAGAGARLACGSPEQEMYVLAGGAGERVLQARLCLEINLEALAGGGRCWACWPAAGGACDWRRWPAREVLVIPGAVWRRRCWGLDALAAGGSRILEPLAGAWGPGEARRGG